MRFQLDFYFWFIFCFVLFKGWCSYFFSHSLKFIDLLGSIITHHMIMQANSGKAFRRIPDFNMNHNLLIYSLSFLNLSSYNLVDGS